MNQFPTQISSFVHDAAPLPGMAWAPVRVLSNLHWYWRWYHKKEIYGNPENWMALAAGHLTNAAYGEGWLRTVAHVILITHRTQLYIQQTELLFVKTKKFKDTFWGVYDVPQEMTWDIPSGRTLFTRTAWKNFEAKSTWYGRHTKKIMGAFYEVMKQLFFVTMHAVEIYDAFYRRHEAFNEAYLNTGQCITALVNNSISLRGYIEENHETIQMVLDRLGFDVKVRVILSKFQTPLGYMEATVYRVQSLNRSIVSWFT